jgi:hypothetical protein
MAWVQLEEFSTGSSNDSVDAGGKPSCLPSLLDRQTVFRHGSSTIPGAASDL